MDLNVAPESSFSLSYVPTDRCHAVEKMTRNSNALMRDGSVMADSGLVDFLSGPTDSAINFNGSADLHTPIHPPPKWCKIQKVYIHSHSRLLLLFTNIYIHILQLSLHSRNTFV